jgi:hypothetical protein
MELVSLKCLQSPTTRLVKLVHTDVDITVLRTCQVDDIDVRDVADKVSCEVVGRLFVPTSNAKKRSSTGSISIFRQKGRHARYFMLNVCPSIQ